MDFLLECIGFPPDHDLERLVELTRRAGERAPWRGPDGEHLRLALGYGLELRADREDDHSPWSVVPYFQSERRLRVALETIAMLPDSRYDALVTGWANPPVGGDPSAARESYAIGALVTDARRLPRDLVRGHVIAMSLAGFALDIDFVGAEAQVPPCEREPVRRFEDGGWIQPLGGGDDPGGCVELCLRVQRVEPLRNPLTGAPVTALEVDAPGRPLVLFTSPWQLEAERLPPPAAGSLVRGVFLLTGRIAGGLASAERHLGRSFG